VLRFFYQHTQSAPSTVGFEQVGLPSARLL
jgi:hypothetical protein